MVARSRGFAAAARAMVTIIASIAVLAVHVPAAHALDASSTAGTLRGRSVTVGRIDRAVGGAVSERWRASYAVMANSARALCRERAQRRLAETAGLGALAWRAQVWSGTNVSGGEIDLFIKNSTRNGAQARSGDAAPDRAAVRHRLLVEKYRRRLAEHADHEIGESYSFNLMPLGRSVTEEPRLPFLAASCLGGYITREEIERYAAVPLYRARADVVSIVCREFDTARAKERSRSQARRSGRHVRTGPGAARSAHAGATPGSVGEASQAREDAVQADAGSDGVAASGRRGSSLGDISRAVGNQGPSASASAPPAGGSATSPAQRSAAAPAARPDEPSPEELAAVAYERYGEVTDATLFKARIALDAARRRADQAAQSAVDHDRVQQTGSECALELPPPPAAHVRGDAFAGAAGHGLPVHYFGNFRCRHCKGGWETIKALHGKYEPSMRVQLRHHFPDTDLKFFNDALQLECSAAQSKLWEYGDWKLAGGQSEAAVADLGLDEQAFNACMEDPNAAVKVLADTEEALRLGFREAVPSWVIGKRARRGFLGVRIIEQTIEDEAALLAGAPGGSASQDAQTGRLR